MKNSFILNSEDNTSIELYAAIVLAVGMVVVMMNEIAGIIIILLSLTVLALWYLLRGIMVKYETRQRSGIILCRVNFWVLTLVIFVMPVLSLLGWLNIYLFVGIMILLSGPLLFNLIHRYVYRFMDPFYSMRQIRIVLLAGLVMLYYLVSLTFTA